MDDQNAGKNKMAVKEIHLGEQIEHNTFED
jgi:hypothetical protein